MQPKSGQGSVLRFRFDKELRKSIARIYFLPIAIFLFASGETTGGEMRDIHFKEDAIEIAEEDAQAFQELVVLEQAEDRALAEALRNRILNYRPVVPLIVGGQLTQAYPTTGALLLGPIPGAAQSQCTGTLIGCRTFLTAAHCVADDPTPGNYQVFFQHAGFFGVEDIEIHPNYSFPVADIAVLTLSAEVNGFAPTPINNHGLVPPGTAGEIVGFGRTGGVNGDYGIKRFGNVTIETCTHGVSNITSICWNYTGSQSNTCNGDSGGPLFIRASDGTTVVAGVTSGGHNASCLPTDNSFDTRVFEYRTWVETTASEPLGAGLCGEFPQVGDGGTRIFAAGGRLDGSIVSRRHTIQFSEDAKRLRIALNALDEYDSLFNPLNDFNMYVKRGTPPTSENFDCAQNGSGQFGYCEFESPLGGTWHVLVERVKGGGAYQLTSVVFE